jgi:seryl-tRNA synthetase
MASAVKVNRSHLIANDSAMHLTRKHIQQMEGVLQDITGCLDNTTAGLETKLQVLEEVTTDNIADMTTAVNTTNREVQKSMETLAQTHTQELHAIQQQIATIKDNTQDPHLITKLEERLTALEKKVAQFEATTKQILAEIKTVKAQ